MISNESGYSEAFVWIWLPGATEPVVAGKLTADADKLIFNYGKSYLNHKNAISIHDAELPLRPGVLPLRSGLAMPGCIRDGAPDAWGRQYLNPFVFDDLEGVYASITKLASEMRTAKKE